jgi:magnesium-transporting ATPase (P-type)
MPEGFAELIKRFFLIKSSYVKTTIALFILATLICSGLLLFIPTLHPLQYPTFALLFTMLSFVGVSCGTLMIVKYENRKIKNTDEAFLQIALAGFFLSCIFTISVILKFIKEGHTWHIAAFLFSQLIELAIVCALFFIVGGAVFYFRTRPLKNTPASNPALPEENNPVNP